MPDETREPYTIWGLDAPINKHGVPVMGNFGSRVRRVVVMTQETFKRLVDENESLKTAQFKVGTYD